MCCVCYRSGVGAPVVTDCEGEYHHDSRKNTLTWSHPVIDSSNRSGSMEFSIAAHPDDFFPISVGFVSKRPYCDLEVSLIAYSIVYILTRLMSICMRVALFGVILVTKYVIFMFSAEGRAVHRGGKSRQTFIRSCFLCRQVRDSVKRNFICCI